MREQKHTEVLVGVGVPEGVVEVLGAENQGVLLRVRVRVGHATGYLGSPARTPAGGIVRIHDLGEIGALIGIDVDVGICAGMIGLRQPRFVWIGCIGDERDIRLKAHEVYVPNVAHRRFTVKIERPQAKRHVAGKLLLAVPVAKDAQADLKRAEHDLGARGPRNIDDLRGLALPLGHRVSVEVPAEGLPWQVQLQHRGSRARIERQQRVARHRVKVVGRRPEVGSSPAHVLLASGHEHRAQNVGTQPQLIQQNGRAAGLLPQRRAEKIATLHRNRSPAASQRGRASICW